MSPLFVAFSPDFRGLSSHTGGPWRAILARTPPKGAEALPGAPEAARADPQPEEAPSPEEEAIAAVVKRSNLELEEEAKAEAKAEQEARAEAAAFQLFQDVVWSDGETGMWLAVLKRAIQDLAIPSLNGKACECGLKNEQGNHWWRCPLFWKKQSLEWFQAKRSKKVGSFRWLCDLFGIKHWKLRQLAFGWAEEELARQDVRLTDL